MYVRDDKAKVIIMFVVNYQCEKLKAQRFRDFGSLTSLTSFDSLFKSTIYFILI